MVTIFLECQNISTPVSARLQAEHERLQEVVQLQRLPGGGTRIVSSMVGWGSGPEWDKAFQFFGKGNEYTCQQLVKCLMP